MNSNEYQKLAWQTAKPFYKAKGTNESFEQLQLTTSVLGLTGQAGELANKLKKMSESIGAIDRLELEEALGDVQWYIAHVATLLGLKLEDVQGHNVAKLRARYPDIISQKAMPKF